MQVRAFLRSVFLENVALKALSLILASALFALVRGGPEIETAVEVPIQYKVPQDRVLVTSPPERVRLVVRGARTHLSQLDEHSFNLPIQVDLTHVPSGEFRFSEDLFALPRWLHLVAIRPPAVHVEMQPRLTRRVPVEVRVEGVPAHGFAVGRLVAMPSDVAVTGAHNVVAALKSVLTMPITITGLRDTLVRQVGLRPLPQHAEYTDSPQVRVEVRIAPEHAELRLLAPIEPPEAHGAIFTLHPDRVTLTLHGPGPLLDQAAQKVRALVEPMPDDGRGAGTYQRKVTVTGLPEGVTARVDPEEVSLNLRKH